MGNGASGQGTITVDGETYDISKLKVLLPELKGQVQEKTNRIHQLSAELQDKDRLLRERDVEIKKLKAEVDKLKSVLQLKVTDSALPGSKPDILAAIGEESGLLVPDSRTKRQGVSGESPSSQQGNIELKHIEKDFR
jgi:cGMP-dependent protein kinase